MPEQRTTQDLPPNPEAIAWYLRRAEALLDELRDGGQSLRIRGGQLAGFSGAVITLVGANASTILRALDGPARGSAAVALLLGTVLLVGAFATALRGANLPQPVSAIDATEIAEYTTGRMIREPDLWRVHVRIIGSLQILIRQTSQEEDKAAVAIERAGRLFLGGLLSVVVSLCILIIVGGF